MDLKNRSCSICSSIHLWSRGDADKKKWQRGRNQRKHELEILFASKREWELVQCTMSFADI
eukprot:scaffold20966_cov31-Attheya_sp.AAC.1